MMGKRRCISRQIDENDTHGFLTAHLFETVVEAVKAGHFMHAHTANIGCGLKLATKIIAPAVVGAAEHEPFVTWLNYHGQGKHLLIDVTVASVFLGAMLKHDRFNVPGYAAAEAEASKFSNDVNSRASVAGQHRLVPFALEESGRIGPHALALLHELAARGVDDGFLRAPQTWLAPRMEGSPY